MPPMLLLHISSATIALIAGTLAMIFRKGSGLHRAAGDAFVVSMLTMSAAGVYLATFSRPNVGNVLGGALTFYLVTTSWVAARRREMKIGGLDRFAFALIVAIALAEALSAYQASTSASRMKDGYTPGMFLTLGSFALLFAASDVRMLRRGGIIGPPRIARHLWRMCLAFLVALVSLYPSRTRLFPAWLNQSNLLYVPHVLLIGSMLWWRAHIASRRFVRPRAMPEEANAPARAAA